MFNKILILTGILFLSLSGLCQKPPDTEAEFEAAYQKRIQKETLDGVYIPKDLKDAFIQLNKLIDDDSKAKFKKMPEAAVAKKLFFSFGRWITYNWGFYGGSRLSNYLRTLGIYFPEDMASFVMIAYHRNLNREKLDIKGLVEYFETKRKKENEARLRGGTILFHESKQLPRPPRDSIKGKTKGANQK